MKQYFTIPLIKTFAFTLLLLTISCGEKDAPEPEPQLERKAVFKVPLNNYDEAMQERKYLWAEEVYDAEGQLILEKYRKLSYNVGGGAIPENLFTEVNTYEGGLLKVKDIEREIPRVKEQRKFAYSNRRLLSMDYLFMGSLLKTYSYEYSSGEKPSKMLLSSYDFTDEPLSYTYTYDAKGHLIKEEITITDETAIPVGTVLGTTTYDYDSHGNLVKETFTNAKSKSITVRQSIKYKYGTDGKVIEELRALGSSGQWFEKHTLHYNDQGYLERKEIFQSSQGVEGPYNALYHLEYEYLFRKH